MNAYQRGKARARQAAIEFSHDVSEMNLSWWECAEVSEKFEKLGRRYGLLREFRENGIC
jgi:hypothetical protein